MAVDRVSQIVVNCYCKKITSGMVIPIIMNIACWSVWSSTIIHQDMSGFYRGQTCEIKGVITGTFSFIL